MIVRCTKCVSAFAVDDEKVSNKKFAFTCPKCGTENIFDNRKAGRDLAEEDIFFEERETPAEKPSRESRPAAAVAAAEEEDMFFDETPAPAESRKSTPAAKDEDIFADELLAETPKQKKSINLEIEETPVTDDFAFDEDILPAEKTPSKKGVSEELVFDEDELFAEEKPAKKIPVEEEPMFDEDILAEEKPAKKAPAEDELIFDDDILGEEKPAKKAPAEEELIFEEDILAEEKPVKKAPVEEELIFEEDIFAEEKPAKKAPVEEELVFDEDILAEEKPVKKAPVEEELIFDEDILDEEKPAKKAPAEEELIFEEDILAEEKPVKKAPVEEELVFDEDFLAEEKPVKKAPVEEELFFDEDILGEEKPAKKAPAEEELILDEDIFAEEKTAKKAPVEEELILDDDIFAEEKPVKKTPVEEELIFDEDILGEEKPSKKAPAEEEMIFDEEELLAEEKPAKKAPVEEELILDDDIFAEEKPVKKAPVEEEILFDEDLELEEKPAKKAPAEEEILFDEEFIIDESEIPAEPAKSRKAEDEFAEIGLELEEGPEAPASDRETKLSTQDDIDALFASAPSESAADGKKAGKKEISPEDDITVNLDELDIELEEEGLPSTDEFISFDEKGEAHPSKKKKEEEPVFDEDITIDMDALDIDIEEAGDFHKQEQPATQKKKPALPESEEEELVLNIDEFSDELEAAALEAPPVKSAKKVKPEDEDITLDLDSLDIDLDEGEAPAPAAKEKKVKTGVIPAEDELIFDEEELFAEEKPAKKAPLEKEPVFEEEELKLNLDEMDVDIEEFEKKELIFDDDLPEELIEKPRRKPAQAEEEEDESITIDLNTLDIEVSETEDVMAGEMTEEEEKLTLDDAGLTFNELTGDEIKSETPETAEEEEIKLTLDEVDPDLKLQVIGEKAPRGERPLIETVEELPEIDLDEYEAVIREEETVPAGRHDKLEIEPDEFLELETPVSSAARSDMDMFEYDEEAEPDYLPEKGSTTFSIDYSLKYSRIGAILRLLGLYMLSLIPHFILMMVYTILSSILGFINQIVILSTGRCVEDFALITENTLRYSLYIQTNIAGIVEDRPVYAGRESLNHQLQLNVTYPVKYSRNFAILRLSMLGIWLITLPHFIVLSMLTVAVPFVNLAGIIMVIATRRWPNPLFIFLTRYFRYAARVSSFLIGLTDEYPPFRFD